MGDQKNNKQESNDYKIVIAKTVEEVERLRPYWEQMQWHPNAEIDHFLLVVDVREEIERPHVIVLYQGNSPTAMLVGRIERVPFEFKIGYAVLYRTFVRSLTIVYGGLLGTLDRKNSDIMVRELCRTLSAKEADIVYLNSLAADSDIAKSTLAVPPLLSRDYSLTKSIHWARNLPVTYEEFTANLRDNHQRWIRGRARALERNYPGKVSTKHFCELKDIRALCVEAEKVASKTYQRALGAGFIDNEENQRRLALTAKKGSLRGYILSVEDTPVAYWIGSLFHSNFYPGSTGYDPAFRKYEPGTVLFLAMVEDLCKSGVKFLDFGFGDALYKQRFGDTKWEEVSMYIFSPTLSGIKIKLLQWVSRKISAFAEWTLEHFKIKMKIKTIWRKWLSPK